ncbi:H+/Cl- exchange transporter 3 [Ceratocystis lukuohia]|uniref:H+/Cl- exchange transporter 3 n=1 Tax=Ceratocystis lukuohia TaxID=2019550 RepID=A0ABR4MNS5_9PEZI
MPDLDPEASKGPASADIAGSSSQQQHQPTQISFRLPPGSATPQPTVAQSRPLPRPYPMSAQPSYLATNTNSDGISDETTPLLTGRTRIRIHSGNATPYPRNGPPSWSQGLSGSLRSFRNHSRQNSWGQRLVDALNDREESDLRRQNFADERVWYDQFTSTDWVRDSIKDAYRVKELRARKGLGGRLHRMYDASQGWILSAVCGMLVALFAYVIDVSEALVFDFKGGYCNTHWYYSQARCCGHIGASCSEWKPWNEVLTHEAIDHEWIEYIVYITFVVALSAIACFITLWTKTVIPSAYQLATLDENLAAEQVPTPQQAAEDSFSPQQTSKTEPTSSLPPMVYYSAAGSGVAEVRVILSGFVLHGFLGLRTLLIKTLALVPSVASGLSVGKEGPYVHIATCIGNIACRLFPKYDMNDGKRREALSAAAAAGVVVAFGAPLGGVLFGLEEVSYFFPAKTLFRTFFCCIVAALSLKFLNPYGTSKIVIFQVKYSEDWKYFEIGSFIFIGIIGGALGALFIKASKHWAKSFRRIGFIKAFPLAEVVLVALVTGIMNYWNMYTRLPVSELVFQLASPCEDDEDDSGLCPKAIEQIGPIMLNLLTALLIKGFLTVITFGIKIPAGIYVPSMVVGALFGRVVGHVVQWSVVRWPEFGMWSQCAATSPVSCIQPGVYGLIGAGSMMCGVTRLSVTLVVILFELTGSLDYVLPFSLAILVSKWTADAIEPNSIYDLLTAMNSYPFLDNKHKPIFTGELAQIIPPIRQWRVIDITDSPVVPATILRQKLELLHQAGELDGGLPIVRDQTLVGLIPAPDLEYALDSLPDEAMSQCLMARIASIEDSDSEDIGADPTDFTPYIDPAPVSLDIQSPMDLVYECFVKLGLRYICVLKDGHYAGMVSYAN